LLLSKGTGREAGLNGGCGGTRMGVPQVKFKL
jgi:hypothetical protein